MDGPSYLPIDDAGPVTEGDWRADQTDTVAIEKETAGNEFCGCPGTLEQEYLDDGYNNIWDDSFPVDRTPRPTSGFRGGGHPAGR